MKCIAESRKLGVFNFVLFSILGICMFFLPVTIGSKTTIPVDHIITAIRNFFPSFAATYAVVVMAWGVYKSFVEKKWGRSVTDGVFSAFNLIGFVIGCMVYFNVGPQWILADDMAPYVFDLVAVPVGLIIPIGSIFLAFIVNYGLLEFTGELMVPVMRPIFHTPGRSAIDAVASFVGSYSIGLILTNNVYKKGGYSSREAAIIGTGFSTVSATFMIIVAKTLGLMEYWGVYFWVTLTVTFLVTAVTVHMPPLSRIPDDFFPGSPEREPEGREGFSGILGRAWAKGVETGSRAPKLGEVIARNLQDGIRMAMTVVAAIMSFGVIALLLAEYTQIFTYTGYVFYPLFEILQVPEALMAGQAASITIADMFLPAILGKGAPEVTRFVIGVLCISEVLFFSGMLPCLLGTAIPLRMRDIFIIWLERVVFSILIVAPIAHLIF